MKDGYFGGALRGLCESLSHSAPETATNNASYDDASEWLSLQKWLHSHSRDVLDESDEILHSRRHLIYAIGHQQYMEGYPDRWTVIQQILRLVKQHAYSLSKDLPDSVEYGCGPWPGSFPHFRILRTSDAGSCLMLWLVEDVMAGRLPIFGFRFLGQRQREAIRSFIFSEDVRLDIAKEAEEYAKHSQHSNLWSGLLLLRGLLASNLLLYALTERRWRVDYGLPLEHDDSSVVTNALAVPYRAKDIPAPETQFGHPDITILLTCLSYYYAGLSEAQLRTCFQTLLNEDDPAAEYALWVQGCGAGSTLPSDLCNLKEFNLKSSEQWGNHIFPIFAHNQMAIDFYLSRIVFPRKAKEFPWKLATSSWDLAEKRERLITGKRFSPELLNLVTNLSNRIFGDR